jgi:nucleoid-associated protein YgaU
MKLLTLVTLLVVIALSVVLAPINPALAQDDEDADRDTNKLLIHGVRQGWAIQVAQPGAEFPRGPGNLPDNAGLVTAYAPLNQVSHVYLWDKARNTYALIATVSPNSIWPDTVIGSSVQFAQGLPTQGLASPVQINPGQPYHPGAAAAPANRLAFTRQHTVQPGDTLSAIARLYGTTFANLAAANGIANPNLIFSGQVLMVP